MADGTAEEKEIAGASAWKTKSQRRIKSIADKAAGQDAGAHLVSPGEWAFIMMPPGTNNRVHFVSPAHGNNSVGGRRWQDRRGEEGGLRETASGSYRHLDSAVMFFCRLIKQPRGRKRRRLPREREEARRTRKGRKTGEREEESRRRRGEREVTEREREREDGRESSCLEVE